MHIFCKKCSKHTANTFPKKLVLISKNKIKGKSRCAISLTERSFIDEVQYDLESALEIYIQFLLTDITNMKSILSDLKPIKTGKQPGCTYCFGCKDYTKNFRPKKVNMTNKVVREKSHCIIYWSNKSRFLKQ